jgi:predicted nucleic acid-binding protein
MAHLVDTGVLLRLLDRNDAHHATIREALRQLRRAGESLVIGPQNIAELWNVSTRPASARGGYGLTIEQVDLRVRIIERIFGVLADGPVAYDLWRRLVVTHRVSGVQVHDARLAALMRVHGVDHVLTLNPSDFTRYDFLVAVTPEHVIAGRPVSGP